MKKELKSKGTFLWNPAAVRASHEIRAAVPASLKVFLEVFF